VLPGEWLYMANLGLRFENVGRTLGEKVDGALSVATGDVRLPDMH
jgi:hypothetical protein